MKPWAVVVYDPFGTRLFARRFWTRRAAWKWQDLMTRDIPVVVVNERSRRPQWSADLARVKRGRHARQ